MTHTTNVAIIGCGGIGQKRAKALSGARLVVVCDTQIERARTLARQYPGVDVVENWHDVVARADVEIVFVATTNNMLAPITEAAVQTGKHVLVEKPAARNADELRPVIAALRQHPGVQVRVGFNHRYHPALIQARRLVDEGALGKLMFIRARYGHGGRVGYDREWRANPELSGGGELLDQGVHLIDLSRWFLGEFPHVDGFATTYYWDMSVDDNGFLLLRTDQQQAAWLHVSCTEWKNLFSFEIYGHRAKLHIEGLGGSYGVERLSYYQMLPEMGPPETIIWEYPRGDNSWQLEFTEFLEDIRLNREPAPGLNDALASLTIVDRVTSREES